MAQKDITISIQQPEFLPWIGFFNKIANVDMVVFLDNVQFKKRYFENRTRIRNYESWQWIGVPVLTKGKYEQNIQDVLIDNSQSWKSKNLKSIELNYKKSPFFSDYFPEFTKLYQKDYEKLATFNLEAIKLLMRLLKLSRKIKLASELNTFGKNSNLILEICKKVKANTYLSGQFGKEYLDEEKFRQKNIMLRFQSFKHPHYRQIHGKFIEGMSILDLLFNEGQNSLKLIKSGFIL